MLTLAHSIFFAPFACGLRCPVDSTLVAEVCDTSRLISTDRAGITSSLVIQLLSIRANWNNIHNVTNTEKYGVLQCTDDRCVFIGVTICIVFHK